MILTRADHPTPGSTLLDHVGGLFKRLRRRKLSFFVTLMVTSAILAAALAMMSPVYRAGAAVIVAGSESLMRSNRPIESSTKLGDPADVESHLVLLRSPEVARQILVMPGVLDTVIAECRAARRRPWDNLAALRSWLDTASAGPAGAVLTALAGGAKECANLAKDPQAAAEQIGKQLHVDVAGRSRVISVEVSASQPQAAALLANAIVEVYLAHDRDRKIAAREAAITWLNGELVTVSRDAREAQEAVEAYRRQNDILRGQTGSIAAERLTSANQQLAVAEAARTEVASRLRQMEGGASMREVLESRVIGELRQKAADVEARFAQSSNLGDNHPTIIALRQQRQEAARQLADESRRIQSSMRRDLTAAEARVIELTRHVAAIGQEVGNAGESEAGLTGLVRNAELKQEHFTTLSRQAVELETERRLVSGDVRLVNRAEAPTKPASPKYAPMAVAGGLLVLVLAVALALCRDLADRTVRSSAELERSTGVPVLGQLPLIGRGRRSSGRALARAGSSAPMQEALRRLYSRCLLLPRVPPRAILVASSGSGEGKTFLMMSLARFMVAAGRRVLVIEGDLRRSPLGETLGLRGRGDLHGYLRGEGTIPEIVCPASPPGLFVILAGTPTVHSTELLGNDRLGQLMDYAKAEFDIVLVDSPPTLALMDAHLLARHVDGVIYCASWGQSRQDAVEEGICDILDTGAPILGLAFTMVREQRIALYETHRLRRAYALSTSPSLTTAGP